jgi:hypothetical protein
VAIFLATGGLTPDDVGRGVREEKLASPDATEVVPVSPEAERQTLSQQELDEAQDREIDRGERSALIRLREPAIYALGGFLAFQLLFMNVILILVGVDELNLRSATLQFYLTGTLGEIFGLVAVAIRFVFSDKPPLSGRGIRR